MEFIEPSTFDVVVLGSGLEESLLASAASLAGKSVLLLDGNDYYGGDWASACCRSLVAGSRTQQDDLHGGDEVKPTPSPPKGMSWKYRLGQSSSSICAIKQYLACGGVLPATTVDMAPKVTFQAEELVEVLVKARAHHYLDLKLIEACLICTGGQLRPVPGSRSDIFKDKGLTVNEKRSLMKFLNNCLEAMEDRGPLKDAFDNRPFAHLLAEQGLKGPLKDILQYSIAWGVEGEASHGRQQGDDEHTQGPPGAQGAGSIDLEPCPVPDRNETQTGEQVPGTRPTHGEDTQGHEKSCITSQWAQQRLRLYMESLGKFGGSSAFLVPSYGTGTYTEAFVRCAAVHGAVTVLRLDVEGVLAEEGEAGRVTAILTTGGQVIEFGHLVIGSQYWRRLLPQPGGPPPSYLSRAVCLLDGSLQPPHHSLLLAIPPGSLGGSPQQVVQGIQLSSAYGVVKSGNYLLYLSTRGISGDPEADLKPVVEALLDTSQVHRWVHTDDQEGTTVPDGKFESSGSINGEGQLPAPSLPAGSSHRPSLLSVIYYHQMTYEVDEGLQLPEHLVVCRDPGENLVGYDQLVESCKAKFLKLLPECEWMVDVKEVIEKVDDHEDKQILGDDEEEGAAIADLQLMVQELGGQSEQVLTRNPEEGSTCEPQEE